MTSDPSPVVAEFVRRLRATRLLGILRGCPDGGLDAVAEAAAASGLRFLEVAMNSPGAAAQIRHLRSALDGNCEIGAGTVLSADQASEAVRAGATFLVSPCLVPEVQRWATENDIPTLPGALSPTEIWNASHAGAAVVKLFPARSVGGPSYFRELRGPFREVPLLACGGVSAANAKEYLEAGADALAFGGSVFTPERLATKDVAGMRSGIVALAERVS
jgi:2-dehydro-3-deoxyphosphogluconate aldolase/(4S)-4-hydroxy-2-oxoglutarate aldolase